MCYIWYLVLFSYLHVQVSAAAFDNYSTILQPIATESTDTNSEPDLKLHQQQAHFRSNLSLPNNTTETTATTTTTSAAATTTTTTTITTTTTAINATSSTETTQTTSIPIETMEKKPLGGGSTEERADSRLLLFIENVVQRTVSKYIRMMQVEKYWIHILLKLVRVEQFIRNRYNCRTDVCIYKIQLFTVTLKPHWHWLKPMMTNKRVRRSISDSELDLVLNDGNNSESPRTVFNFNIDETISEMEKLSRNIEEVTHSVKDDALRLSHAMNNKSKIVSDSKSLLDRGRTHNNGAIANFGIPDKFDMKRLSQQESLRRSLQAKKTVILPSMEGINNHSDSMSTEYTTPIADSESSTMSDVTPSTITSSTLSSSKEATMATIPKLPVFDMNLSQLVDNFSVDALENSINEPIEKGKLKKPNNKENNSTLSNGSAIMEERDDILQELLRDRLQNWTKNDNVFGRNVNFSETTVRLEDPLPSTKRSSSVPAIPFGMNYDSKPFDNCTEKYKHYCFNGAKCVYVPILETAVCYCQPGYMGVRCDLFNLPQSLDVLNAFRDRALDIPSLHKASYDTLHKIIEAMARYTVNAVLEDQYSTGAYF